jgi:hypothetical protein
MASVMAPETGMIEKDATFVCTGSKDDGKIG